MAKFDWQAFEDALFEEVRLALVALAAAQPEERFYALALHGIDAERDHLLSLPLLGLAPEAGSAPPDAEGFWGPRWNPEDWAFSEVPLREKPALALERKLTRHAIRSTVAHWDATLPRYEELLVALALRLRDAAPSILAVTSDFVAFVHHPSREGIALAARTIPAPIFEREFAAQVALAARERELAARPAGERAAFLATRLGTFDGVTTETAERELVAIGSDAIDALLPLVEHPNEGWIAAKLLGHIGVPRPDVIASLRERADGTLWPAMALGMLGDFGWLAQQAPRTAALGLTARLRAITSGGTPYRLDYRPLESWIAARGPEAVELAEKELQPGSSYAAIAPTDVDEALRGLCCPAAVVRWHACASLRDRALGRSVGKRALPALASALGDPHPIVRRLALLSISAWKAQARPFMAAIEPLCDDPDPIVRRMAAHTLGVPER